MSNPSNNTSSLPADDLKPDQAVWPEQEPPDPEKIQRPKAGPKPDEVGLLPPVYSKAALPPSLRADEPLLPKSVILPILAAAEKIKLAAAQKKDPVPLSSDPDPGLAGRFRAKLKKILERPRPR